MRLILASASTGRLRVLRQAGLDPEVIVSGLDEDLITEQEPSLLARLLAQAKGRDVVPRITGDAILVACDSVLEVDGRAHGKPGTVEAAVQQWHRLRGREGTLRTGHYVWVRRDGQESSSLRLASTVVRFADLSDAEIEAYAATGEPLPAAGAFTIDGLGGAFISSIEGDPHNVIGISLPLLRQVLLDLGVTWHSLWRADPLAR